MVCFTRFFAMGVKHTTHAHTILCATMPRFKFRISTTCSGRVCSQIAYNGVFGANTATFFWEKADFFAVWAAETAIGAFYLQTWPAGGCGERDVQEGIVKKGSAREPCGGSGERMEPDKGQNLFWTRSGDRRALRNLSDDVRRGRRPRLKGGVVTQSDRASPFFGD